VFLVRSAGHPGAGFAVPGLFGAFATSIGAATISCALVTLLGVPLAYLLARHKGPLAAVAGAVVQLPLALPPLVSGVLLLYVLGPYSLLGRVTAGEFTESLAGIVLAQSFVASPFLVVAARSAFRSVDPNLADVAATAGLAPLVRFARVDLPIAAPSIRAGMVLTWLRAFGEYGATVMLAYHPYSLPVFTYVQFSAVGLPATQASALLALGLALVVVSLSRLSLPRFASKGPGDVESRPAAAAPVVTVTSRPVPVGFDLSTITGSFQLRLRYQASGHRLALVGPSGAGKSLTIRALAGLSPGHVTFAGRPVSRLPPEQRKVGYVPQGQSLMPHLHAWDNVTLGPHADPAAAADWMAALGIADLAARRPGEMSGGQRQRVSLARAFSCHPDVVMLDEPFTGLDAPARTGLLQELRRLQRESGLSSVLVTHDFTEAALLADEVVVISSGELLQAGRLLEVFAAPASPEVARILGYTNIHAGAARSRTSLTTGQLVLTTGHHGIAPGEGVVWCVRPERVHLTLQPSDGACPARLVDVADLGTRMQATVELSGGIRLQAEIGSDSFAVPPLPASPCWVRIPPDAVLVWAGELPAMLARGFSAALAPLEARP
jgi:molybdate transport system ATP-binding protein/molybdate transport system permease protein